MRLHCIRGCVVPRRHIVQTCECQCHQGAVGAYLCDVEGGCYENHQHPDDCKGCQPREAAIGQVCLHCHGQLTEAVGRVPDLIEHLRAHIEPGAVRRDDMPRASGKHSPAPLNLDAVDAADGLYAVLASWHETVTGELELSAFSPVGYIAHGKLAGLPSQGADSSATMADRITRHLDRACAYEWVGDMVTELHETVRSALTRWPNEERPLYLPTPCPACDMLSLVRTAPQAFRGRAVISCRSCKNTITEDLYDWRTRSVLATKQEEARLLAEAVQEEVDA